LADGLSGCDIECRSRRSQGDQLKCAHDVFPRH
jgi:hypothetical protein